MLYWKESTFLNLTYDEQNLPINGSLCKKHLQDFWKRFRARIKSPIKYYGVGEYGEKSLRPHYHAIIFGWQESIDKLSLHRGLDGKRRFSSSLIAELWPLGNNIVGVVEHDSIQYVCGYIRKKLVGKDAEYYVKNGLAPPFMVNSKGLGKRYAQDNAFDLATELTAYEKGKAVGLPRYYTKVLELDSEVLKRKGLEHEQSIQDYCEEKGWDEKRSAYERREDRRQRDRNIRGRYRTLDSKDPTQFL